VKLVTIDIGANDLESCAGESGIDEDCVHQAFDDLAENLPKILGALRFAAGPPVPIVGMNYYNPYLATWLDPQFGPAFATGTNGILASFNELLEFIYGEYQMPVADVATAFNTDQFAPLVDVDGIPFSIPLNVAMVCGYTYLCAPGEMGGNIHPTDAGYGIITQAFLGVLPLP
jgi:lysophospholipase L1-like esterase